MAVVRAMWQAAIDGRWDDFIALMHRTVVGHPLARPGLSHYAGPAAMRTMWADTEDVIGALRVVIEDIFPLADGTVFTRGHTVSLVGRESVLFRVVCFVQDGLIARIDSLPANEPDPTRN